LGFEREVVHPPSDGVAQESLLPHFAPDFHAALDELGELATIGPDDPPPVVVLIENRDLVFVLKICVTFRL
jgi:hypothetical protein